MTPQHIHHRDLTGFPGSDVIKCGQPGYIHTGKLWRVTCPACLTWLDLRYDASRPYTRDSDEGRRVKSA